MGGWAWCTYVRAVRLLQLQLLRNISPSLYVMPSALQPTAGTSGRRPGTARGFPLAENGGNLVVHPNPQISLVFGGFLTTGKHSEAQGTKEPRGYFGMMRSRFLILGAPRG